MTEYHPYYEDWWDDLAARFPATRMFFENLGILLGQTLNVIKIVRKPSASGTDYVLDSFDPSTGSAVFYLYVAKSSGNKRSGFINTTWLTDGTLPDELFQEMDAPEIGDTSDLTFSFEYDSTSDKIRLLLNSTSTYRFVAVRIMAT